MNHNIRSSSGHGTRAVIQTHKSVNEWRIRMFRPTDMDPRMKGASEHSRPRSKCTFVTYKLKGPSMSTYAVVGYCKIYRSTDKRWLDCMYAEAGPGFWLLTLSMPQVIIIGFCKQQRSRWDGSYEPSHLDLRCLTFSLSTLHINFSSDKLLKKKSRRCRLKFGTERVKLW